MTNSIRQQSGFGHTAIKLARNPLGILALALVLVYAIAVLLVAGITFEPAQMAILVWFLAIFPFAVLLALYLLVAKHHDKLYAPSDFTTDDSFVRLFELRADRAVARVDEKGKEMVRVLQSELEKRVDEIEMATRENLARQKISEGMLDVSNGHYKSALRNFENCIREFPLARAWELKAFTLKRLTRTEEALESLEKAFEFPEETDPNLARRYFNRACYKALLSHDIDSIVADLKASIALDPDYVEYIADDTDLASIRGKGEIQQLLAAPRNPVDERTL